MSTVLTIDVGAGTMDVLFIDTAAGVHYKAVVRSPVETLAQQIRSAGGRLLVVGSEMGGGVVTLALKERAAAEEVVISASAAATVAHNLEKARSLGLAIVSDARANELAGSGDFSVVRLSDLEIPRLRQIVEGFGVEFEFDVVGVCVQDHGIVPAGESHLDYRHNHFTSLFDSQPFPHVVLHRDSDVPEDMSRLRAVAAAAHAIPCREVYVMDSGMAAILGASMDPRVRSCRRSIVLDVATSHTVAAVLEGEELCAFVEFHTKDIDPLRMDSLLKDLADGRLSHEQIVVKGGHGAYTRRPIGFDVVEIVLATGPKRALLGGTPLDITLGAPLGDNMMTGAVGLLEAIRRRKGWPEIAYE